MPLDQELYSQEAPDFVSENDEILKAVGSGLEGDAGPRRVGDGPGRRPEEDPESPFESRASIRFPAARETVT